MKLLTKLFVSIKYMFNIIIRSSNLYHTAREEVQSTYLVFYSRYLLGYLKMVVCGVFSKTENNGGARRVSPEFVLLFLFNGGWGGGGFF